MYLGFFVLTLAGFAAASVWGTRRMKTSTDFALAGRGLTGYGVSWVIIGTLVGGASTVGTVQLAYTHGLAAWIFTLGSGISCLVLGLVFSGPLRRESPATVAEYIGHTFGRRAQYYCSFFVSSGMFLQVVAQCLAAVAVLRACFVVSERSALALCFLLIFVFVTIGGISGSRAVGRLKAVTLYLVMILSAVLLLGKAGGFGEIARRLPADMDYANLFAYGTTQGTVDILSMVVGVISTQTYLQAVFAARDVRQARKGAFLSAALIPPIGLMGILIGLYLRAYHPEVGEDTAQALPYFINTYFPGPLAAFFTAGILVTALGTASGLVLGVSTNLYVDFVKETGLLDRIRSNLTRIRICTLAVLAASLALVLTGLDSVILEWSYVAMGLRGSAIFVALCLIVFARRWVPVRYLAWPVFICPLAYVVHVIMVHLIP
jgi:SSS family solute:Na+ symporter